MILREALAQTRAQNPAQYSPERIAGGDIDYLKGGDSREYIAQHTRYYIGGDTDYAVDFVLNLD